MRTHVIRAALATLMTTALGLPVIAQQTDLAKNPKGAISEQCAATKDPSIDCDCLNDAASDLPGPAAVAAAAQLSGNAQILRFTQLSMSSEDKSEFEDFMLNAEDCGVPGELPPPPPE